MAKSFKSAATPVRTPTTEEADAFVNSGKSVETVRKPNPPRGLAALQAHARVNAQFDPASRAAAPTATSGPKEKLARLSLDMSPELHTRFKVACARARLKMTAEILAFIERRTAELEKTHK